MTARPKHGIPVALVAPGSLLGRDIRAVLKERRFPVSALHLFHTKGGADGILTEDDDEAAFMAPLAPDSLETSRIAFFCGDPEDSARFLASRAEDECLLIDVSGLRAGGPFAAPGASALPYGNLFLTYDPIASVLADALRAVETLTRVEAVTAAIDRPVSELGKRALDELFQQSIALAAFRPVPTEVLGTQSAFNIVVPPDTAAFDARVAEDFQRLAGRPISLHLLSARAGIFHGHFLRMELRLESAAPPAEALLQTFRSLSTAFEITDPENLSGPVECAGRDETLVLGVRSSERSVRLTLATDHLRRGGAIMAVRLAEQAILERGLLHDA